MSRTKRDRCPSRWHVFAAWKGQHLTIDRNYGERVVHVPWATAESVLGCDPWEWLDCPTLDQARRMTDDRQASRPHPAVKPNRRRAHRRRS